MAIYLLDTNVISDIIRAPLGLAAAQFEHKVREGGSILMTSVVVVSEIRFGLEKNPSPALILRVNRFLGTIAVVPLPLGVAKIYGSIRADPERRGEVIGPNDLFIAAHVVELGATLVTDNVDEFERVQGLRVENWLRD